MASLIDWLTGCHSIVRYPASFNQSPRDSSDHIITSSTRCMSLLCVTWGLIACWFSHCIAFQSSLVRRHPVRAFCWHVKNSPNAGPTAYKQRTSSSSVTNSSMSSHKAIIYHLHWRAVHIFVCVIPACNVAVISVITSVYIYMYISIIK